MTLQDDARRRFAARHAADCRVWAVERTKSPDERDWPSPLRDCLFFPENYPRHVRECSGVDE